MATTRLRKTFHYPDSSDDEDTVEAGLDAQDQETLLSTLQTRDTSSTRIYTLLLLIFPASITLLTLPGLFSISTFLPSLLALASLAASAYTLYFLPLPPRSAGIIVDGQIASAGKGKGRAIGGYGLNTSTSSARQGERKDVPWLSDEVQELLAQYIVPANGVVCGLLVLLELIQGREWREGMMIGGGYLPGLVLTVVLWARRELRVVDMSELQQLRS
ncbi:hypothetical protein BU25DRAFT_412837 [Macroventuria anomochaeta]|uniref:Uncharacterized protein n=1 Tax=Macroventuria anomochaeta TaxID=301207 RepID=A0ACB6RTR2_9PLEO|nr:uncharacterized protein BU25DRAFT_412837 [Macroventuria anomochaeta]KAF2625400.1 hypothetical protein BU25DRAFT_412837 [Macroventuria anomochaeta]